MAEFIKGVFYLFLILIMVVFIGFFLNIAGNTLGLWQYSFFAPRVEQVRYNTFKESQSYNDGMLRDIIEAKTEYEHADAGGKAALRAVTLHRFEIYDIGRLPPDLQNFYRQLQQGQ